MADMEELIRLLKQLDTEQVGERSEAKEENLYSIQSPYAEYS